MDGGIWSASYQSTFRQQICTQRKDQSHVAKSRRLERMTRESKQRLYNWSLYCFLFDIQASVFCASWYGIKNVLKIHNTRVAACLGWNSRLQPLQSHVDLGMMRERKMTQESHALSLSLWCPSERVCSWFDSLSCIDVLHILRYAPFSF
jgi:hypothetical protein